MSDDIVTRIRNAVDPDALILVDSLNDICKTAADEIERLRIENKQYRAECAGLYENASNDEDEIERLQEERDNWRKVAETEHIRFTNEIESLRRTNKLWMGLWEDCVERQKSTENGKVVTQEQADDIVTQLRQKYQGQLPICAEAADEIEHLRQLADNLAHHLQGYVCQCNMSKCKCGYDDVMDEYQAVRGE